jgi:hypothetical protein
MVKGQEKSYLPGKEGGRRGKKGRPRLRWRDDVESDLGNMDVNRQRTRAWDRIEWASVMKEAKVKLKWMYC